MGEEFTVGLFFLLAFGLLWLRILQVLSITWALQITLVLLLLGLAVGILG